MKISYLVLAGALGLAACDVVTHPVAVVGPANTVYRGTATATLLEGGWFQVTNGFTSIQLQWDIPTYNGHSLTEIWRSNDNVLGNATFLASTNGNLYTDAPGNNFTGYSINTGCGLELLTYLWISPTYA